MKHRAILAALFVACGVSAIAQDQSDATIPPPAPDKRVFGVLPNYRTVEDVGPYQPIPTKRKFYIAAKDSFDYPVFFLSAAYAGFYQLQNSNPQFGQGMEGYAKRFAASYGDQVIGNFLAEAVFPTMLHEDPRYFRRGRGAGGARTRYAISRIFVTRTDSGGHRFNNSEIFGNASAVAISNIYYTGSRTVSDNVTKLGLQLATDATSNILKEFWPDIKRKWFSSHDQTP